MFEHVESLYLFRGWLGYASGEMNRGSEGEIGGPSSNFTRVYYITLRLNKKNIGNGINPSDFELNSDRRLPGKIVVILQQLLMLHSLSKK